MLVGVAQELVVVDLDHEGDAVRVLARDAAQDAKGRGHGVTAALKRKLDDLLWVKVDRVGRERGASRVLDPLIHRQDRQVAALAEATMTKEAAQAAQDAMWTI